MRVLIVGGGGREHALGWCVARDGHTVYAAPGNAGLASVGELVPIEGTQVADLADFARANRIDYTIVGPEAPLVAGLVDEFLAQGLSISGPKRGAARVEGSKVFSKNLMRRHRIPTADFDVFDDPADARRFIEARGAPIVVKADGLAAGKGVIVARDKQTALQAVEDIMEARVYGDAGRRIVVEQLLTGQEVSVLVFTDGETVVPLVPARDHKPAYDGDLGPNTGGMGCFSPVPLVDDSFLAEALEKAARPTVAALRSEGVRYRGVLYVGMMITNDGLKVLEYNARFGDPETQVQLPRLDTPLVEILQACSEGRLDEVPVRWKNNAAVAVVVAAEGYPGRYEKGRPIGGLDKAAAVEGALVFHAGTAIEDGQTVTSGGRVLAVTGVGADISEARKRAYAGAAEISFAGAWYRKDIAATVSAP
jgi:phosphoribosylamine---glycine ligase